MAQVSRGRRLMGEINVVPYIDVMLVLLIIFMVTAPLLTQGVKVDLPKAGAQPIEAPKNTVPLVLSVDRAGRLYLNNGSHPQSPLDPDTVEQRTGGRRFERLDDVISQDEMKAMFEGYQKVAGSHVQQVSQAKG